MRTPESLLTLIDYGIIDEVIRPLMSGKEADVFEGLANRGDELRAARFVAGREIEEVCDRDRLLHLRWGVRF